MTISESILSLTGYPVPSALLEQSCIKHGLYGQEEVTAEILSSPAYQLVKADVYEFLAGAPNVTQNSVSFSFSQDQRDYFLSLSRSIRDDLGYSEARTGQQYGYMGEDF